MSKLNTMHDFLIIIFYVLLFLYIRNTLEERAKSKVKQLIDIQNQIIIKQGYLNIEKDKHIKELKKHIILLTSQLKENKK